MLKRGNIAIHAVQAFDDDPRATCAAVHSPRSQMIGNIPAIIVTRGDSRRSGKANAVTAACMDQLVVNNDVAVLRKGREQRRIGRKAAREEQSAFGSKKSRGFFLEKLVLGVIAAQ